MAEWVGEDFSVWTIVVNGFIVEETADALACAFRFGNGDELVRVRA
jgi:hypothetical protein